MPVRSFDNVALDNIVFRQPRGANSFGGYSGNCYTQDGDVILVETPELSFPFEVKFNSLTAYEATSPPEDGETDDSDIMPTPFAQFIKKFSQLAYASFDTFRAHRRVQTNDPDFGYEDSDYFDIVRRKSKMHDDGIVTHSVRYSFKTHTDQKTKAPEIRVVDSYSHATNLAPGRGIKGISVIQPHSWYYDVGRKRLHIRVYIKSIRLAKQVDTGVDIRDWLDTETPFNY